MKPENQFSEVTNLIEKARRQAYTAVNKELIDLYWRLGKLLSEKINNSGWGKSVIENLAVYLKRVEPDTRGFSVQNLWRMKRFYEIYADDKKLSPVVREISWTNNLMIISKTKSTEEREFYVKLSLTENLSKRELERQIDSGLYERVVLSNQNLSPVLKEIYPGAEYIFKDNYVLDFLGLPAQFSELNLRKAIIKNLKKFILEFGRDFTFVGEEYRVSVGDKDFYIDLLFFHRELQCLIAIDLKITDFKPEFLGKMEFYLEALDRDVKKAKEAPSVGIILCKNKDSEIVEYALSRSMSPALVAKYQTELFDKKLLENKLDEFFRLAALQKDEEE